MAMTTVLPQFLSTVATNQWYRIKVDGADYDPQNARKSHSVTSQGDTLRFELRDGEQHWWDAAVGKTAERSEITGKTYYRDGTPIEVSYGFMLEKGAPNTAQWSVLGQLHVAEWEGDLTVSPPFSFGLEGEKLIIKIGYTKPDGTNVHEKIYTDVYDIDRGHKYDLDVKTVFDADGNGRLIVTRDGVALVDYSGPLGYAQQKSVYWAEGIYREGSARETIVAEYSNLDVKSGSDVVFPTGNVYIGAPTLAVDSVADATANGMRSVALSGTSKAGTYVTISDGQTVLGGAWADAGGHFSVTVDIRAAAHSEFHAYALDATGRKGVDAQPMVIEIGTAANISARLLTIADTNVGAIVITDDPVIAVAQGKLSYVMGHGKDALDAIQGDFTFLETQTITGQAYNRQNLVYDEEGVLIERLRYSGSKLIYDDKIAYDGSHVLTTANSKGGTDVLSVSADGKSSRLDQYASNGKLSFVQIKAPDGTTEVQNYNTATGLQINYTITHADKSKEVGELNLVGRTFATQIYTYDTAGKMISQDRIEADGTKIWSQIWKPDGAREIHNYNGVTGKETTYTIFSADGSRTEGRLDIAGKAYAGIATVYDKANKVIGTDTFDSAGKALTSERLMSDGVRKVFDFSDAGLKIGYTLYALDGSRTAFVHAAGAETKILGITYYSAAGEIVRTERYDGNGNKLTETHVNADGLAVVEHVGADGGKVSEAYAADGRLVSSDVFDQQGRKLSHEVFQEDGSSRIQRFDASGRTVSQTTLTADGLRVEDGYLIANRDYTQQNAVYDEADRLVEMTRWSGGRVTFTEKVHEDGSHTVKAYLANGNLTQTDLSASGKVTSIVTTDSQGRTLTQETRHDDGSREVHRFDGATGSELGYSVFHADKSRTEVNLAIKSKVYDEQHAHYDAAGKLVEMTRFLDDKLIFREEVDNGLSVTRNYDGSGRETSGTTHNQDGSRDTFNFYYDGTGNVVVPTRTQQDHINASGQREWTDVTNANGTHNQVAYSAPATLTSHSGVRDVLTGGTGADRFVFDDNAGNDTITRFAVSGPARDLIQIDRDAAHSFDDLAMKMVGTDTFIDLGSGDSITLANVKIGQLTQEHFLFV